jgi:hypothetical protein
MGFDGFSARAVVSLRCSRGARSRTLTFVVIKAFPTTLLAFRQQLLRGCRSRRRYRRDFNTLGETGRLSLMNYFIPAINGN